MGTEYVLREKKRLRDWLGLVLACAIGVILGSLVLEQGTKMYCKWKSAEYQEYCNTLPMEEQIPCLVENTIKRLSCEQR